MLKVNLSDISGSRSLHTFESLVEPKLGKILLAETQSRTHGVFKTTQFTVAATKILAETIPGGAIVLTDIVVSSKKKAAATIIVQFTDDTQTEIFLAPDIINDTANIVWQPQGLIMGWKDARIECITDATFDATVVVGYVKIREGLEYSEWDGLR